MKSKFKWLNSTRIAVILCVFTMVIYWLSYMEIKNIEYPLKDEIPKYSAYVQQFDAFMKGQLHIDWEVDEKLLEMENPYNYEEREKIKVDYLFDRAYYDEKYDSYFITPIVTVTKVDYLFDRAYYDGKYYSYFGITPIITVMFPFYLLSGMLPAPLLVQFIYMLIFAIFFPKLVMMLLDKYSKKTPAGLKILLTYIAYLSSFNLLIGRGTQPFYYIASTAAIAFLTWFAYLFFKGIYTENHKKRCIYFLAAGLMFSLSFHARVIKAFTGVFFIVPVVIFYLILGKQTWKKKLIELGCLSFFVVIGFVFSFAYNYARFDDIFEFGANYQLTMTDVTEYKLDISEFDDAVEYYYKAELIDNMMNDKWEFMRDKLKLTSYNRGSVDRFLYVSEYFGLYAVPFMIFSLMAIVIVFLKKNSWSYKITLLSTVVGGFIMAWLDFCLGGVHFRYLTDFSTEIAVCSALVVLYILEMSYSLKNKKVAMLVKTFIVIMLVVSIYKAFQIIVIDSINLFDIKDETIIERLFNVNNSIFDGYVK